MKYVYLVEYEGHTGIGIGKERVLHNCERAIHNSDSVGATDKQIVEKAVKLAAEIEGSILYVPESFIKYKKWDWFTTTLTELEKLDDPGTEIAEFLLGEKNES